MNAMRLFRPLSPERVLVLLLVFAGLASTLSAQDRPATLQRQLSANIPVQLRHLRLVDPFVEFIVRVDSDGRIVDFVATEASHHKLIDRAEAVIGRTRCEPAMRDGQPVPSHIRVRVYFSDPAEDLLGFVEQSGLDHIMATTDSLGPKPYHYAISPASSLDQPLERIDSTRVYVPVDQEGQPVYGSTTIEFYVDRSGKVRVPRVLQADDPEIARAALLTLEKIEFSPPKAGGISTTVKVRLPFKFNNPDAENAS